MVTGCVLDSEAGLFLLQEDLFKGAGSGHATARLGQERSAESRRTEASGRSGVPSQAPASSARLERDLTRFQRPLAPQLV